MLKYNYVYCLDMKTMKEFVVTIAFEQDGSYAFAVQSPKDRFVKSVGRTRAALRYNAGERVQSGFTGWRAIKDHFALVLSGRNLHNCNHVIPKIFESALIKW